MRQHGAAYGSTLGATSRSAYLPPGTWFPWSGGASVGGATTITAAADVGEIPVYARAGALVVAYPDGVETLSSGIGLVTKDNLDKFQADLTKLGVPSQ